jgi:PAS domain S-box-containing protein
MLLIEDERFIEANDAAVRLLGYTDAAALLGVTPAMISPALQPDGEPSASKAQRCFLAVCQGQSARFSWEHRDSRGQPVHVDVLLAPISQQGRTRVLCSWHDIGEARQTEAALRRSNIELEQFAYVASHDLRQPLRMITSYVQLLERRLGPVLDDDTRKMMHFVTDGAQRMDQMLVSLLEYSRVGRKGEPMAALDTRSALDEALRFLSPSVRESGAAIRIAGQWPTLLASRDEFTRLLQNLIGNAIKYRSHEHPVELTIAAEHKDEQWEFCVADNGIGIDPAQFDRLFRVFQRLHARDEYEGCGIGLAVCRKIVERHGGRIWVESAGPGQGTTFRFTLPDQPSTGHSA